MKLADIIGWDELPPWIKVSTALAVALALVLAGVCLHAAGWITIA